MTGAASTKAPVMPRPLRMLRRETFSTLMWRSKPRSLSGFAMMFMSHSRRCEMDCVLDALVAAAAADVTGHRFADLVMRRLRVLVQERCRLHDLAYLAVAALRDIHLAPRLLHRMVAGRVEAFDGGDFTPDDVVDRRDAGTHRLLVDHHGAGAAECLTAAEFRAGQS